MNPLIRRHLLTACALLIGVAGLHAPSAQAVECIVPAKPGGGMDGACKMMRKVLPLHAANAADAPIKISYLPGGIGAVAWSSVVSQRRGGPDTLVTFSGGSLLNLAQGKFGKAAVSDVRWLAGFGVDYGMIAVRSESPYKNLRELVDAMRSEPDKITIGMSGTVGSQDWLKVAMIARRAGIDPRNFRFVALEGGGDSFAALQANHVQVVSGDASEAAASIRDGTFRVLAVLSEQRLPGVLAGVATAREQGFDVVWPIIRGFYMSAQVSDADYRRWVAVFNQIMATEEFQRQRMAGGLYPFAMTGAQLTDYVSKLVEQYRRQSQELGLVR
ncbi:MULTISPECIES: tripartite tricarboxylate transporter substrate-binding protein [unclassified Herbaspirillum]|uniref:Bug family tripartite tricarboxylate transporter substrate binding protein n=1 Tax=unclassified Herbaspirillum TaxID=2624150 RepID=UPI000E2F7387|nr:MULTISPECIES: tripartite tricarboxylate transporter substrate-binding protein [unclassified Herbaspirillum]RFB71064.1 tripartite tricarboxylate transporter substrate binding protein [Herbaspirillum sp. 3R-3a1]TFI08413.1 tripartite tricarboxylate transporter substrate binding protein [Herbaspirillum sp. 3R11]TFI14828.1 tripartite tricarboxylate transporter substrate binding protein [Herbaspirillum sp. 3R-11]TFI29416.1 tripartite tricarboxylate transporter substrate binding protein [Herbaspiri